MTDEVFSADELTYLRGVGSKLGTCREDPQRTAAARVRGALEVVLGRRSAAFHGRQLLASLLSATPKSDAPASGAELELISSAFSGEDTGREDNVLARELHDIALQGIASVAVASEIERLLGSTERNYRRAEVVVIPGFLDEAAHGQVRRFADDKEAALKPTAIFAENLDAAAKASYRSSLSTSAESLRAFMLPRLLQRAEEICARLRFEEFVVDDVEIQYTVSVDGDHYGMHTDSSRSAASGALKSRLLTFVYYFHAMPKAFTGGELRVHDTAYIRDTPMAAGSFAEIVPQPNTAVFFDAALLHEVLTVQPLEGRLTAESGRRTLNGWLHGRRR